MLVVGSGEENRFEEQTSRLCDWGKVGSEEKRETGAGRCQKGVPATRGAPAAVRRGRRVAHREVTAEEQRANDSPEIFVTLEREPSQLLFLDLSFEVDVPPTAPPQKSVGFSRGTYLLQQRV